MGKQLVRFVCIVAISAGSLALWETLSRAADKTININPGPNGPVFDQTNVTISKGQSVQWVPKTPRTTPHHLVQKMPDGTEVEITQEFKAPNTASHEFDNASVAQIQCIFHRATMNQTITVR